ncbi:hypothetical protein PG994_004026 [Apiospora phragmitis]|uniref:SH3 domain-containing protein n=1 Tax=Apiospora phragmitis TaxID=2905665 RepID=A0ABR1VZS6_9PEZI
MLDSLYLKQSPDLRDPPSSNLWLWVVPHFRLNLFIPFGNIPTAQHDEANYYSIDLQDPDTPSAKDHKNATANGQQQVAPHQAETLREVAAETKEERRISWANGDIDLQQYADEMEAAEMDADDDVKAQQRDALAIAQNGGSGASDDGDMDTDGDGDLDDDMMDKISSSPSIEDGGCPPELPPCWPARVDSLRSRFAHSPHVLPGSPVLSEARSSSPYLEHPEYLPLDKQTPQERQSSKASAHDTVDSHPHHHHVGEYAGPERKHSQDNMDDYEKYDYNDHPMEKKQDDDMAWEDVKEHPVRSTTNEPPTCDIVSPILDGGVAEACAILGVQEDDSIISPYDFLVPYHSSEDDDDDDDFSLPDDSRFVDSGWGGECLQDTEDIDFEFVYALHTFVATVEGQANATKGDTMVLLDDSNSYWWLVRVVKDSSIGYLPAEHIETPTERLARLNKHRNIDLAATMLGDQVDKQGGKNSLKSAMRKRKGKNVTFTAPTYVDYSDFDYSTEEEDADGDVPGQQAKQQDQQATSAATGGLEDDESARVAPLKPRSQQTNAEDADENGADEDEDRASDEIFDNGKSVTRTTKNGTVRNTDSFFKDETVETKKISLTPNLLRDDGEARESTDSTSKELLRRPSFEKELVADKKEDKKKKDKKDKEKKPSAIRSFFSRKDKKKSTEDDDESFGKRSMDVNSVETVEDDARAAEVESPDKGGRQRSNSKLQKQQARVEPSPTRKAGSSTMELAQFISSEGRPPNNVANVPPTGLRMVEADPAESEKAALTTSSGKPQKLVKPKARMGLDDFDTSEEEEEDDDFGEPGPTKSAPAPAPLSTSTQEPQQQPQPQQQQHDRFAADDTECQRGTPMERLSESPVHVSPIASNNPPALMGDNSSQEDRSSPISSPSPDVADVDTSGPSSILGTDIRDLLVVVYDDKTDVPPANPEHPIAGSLFREQNAKLAEITTQLDNMLGDWLARKQRLRGSA